MNYYLERVGSRFTIIERDTKQVVFSHTDKKTTMELMQNLNSGSGFDGWTPEFILQSGKNILEKTKV
jgi:hypothetical protein